MAILHSVSVGDSGVTASYWRIARGTFSFEGYPSYTITFSGYLDKESRQAGRRPVPGAMATYELDVSDFPEGTDFREMSLGSLYLAVLSVISADPKDLLFWATSDV